mgnify:CR=1 FL=1
MASDRNQMLEQFVKNKDLIELTGISEEDISGISFSSQKGDLLIDCLKKMIFSYCENESSMTTIRKVNVLIKTEAD